ncbi:unnamed protein product [Adineta ricciae]|uniref:Uncharacterized protein n=1 Tax=Adineta ricciae TaxID=249248 RepID=A0A816E7W6_ADIRI|nr:unnamed protein product [Adineta ricciae]
MFDRTNSDLRFVHRFSNTCIRRDVMAKSGFVPAWMKIQSSDKTNGSTKITLDRNNYQSQASNRSETSSTSSSPPTSTGRQRHHSSDISDPTITRQSPFHSQQTFGQTRNGFGGHSESFFTFSSSRRSYSRERAPSSFAKHIESSSNGHDNNNGYRSINTSQRRLHSISSYSNDRPLSNIRHNSVNDDRGKIFGTNDHEQTTDPSGFDRLEQDFPSLNGREKHDSSSNERSSNVWNNAASKFRTSHNEPFKPFDRSLSNNVRTIGSNRISTRKDRLLSTPNGVNGTSTPRSITLELQTNCITQTKNLDKRSDFFNSLKYGENKNGVKRQYNPVIKPTTLTSSDRNVKVSNATLLVLPMVETPEEKELLIRMGWNEYDEVNYEITDKDKEEYEKQMKLLHKTNYTSAALISALYRRVLPCIDIRDLLRFEMSDSHSDYEECDD